MPARLLCLVAFIAVMSQFGGTLSKLIGVPNVLPLIRDGMLMALALLAISRTDVFKARWFFVTVLSALIVLVINISIAAMENLHFAGIYYARLYVLPILFTVAARQLILQAPAQEVIRMARLVFWCGTFVVVVAFGIFSAIEVNPSLLYTLMGSLEGQPLATAWYIAGGTWLRMGLPATSPNALGLILAFYLLLLIPLMIDGRFLAIGKFTRVSVVLLASLGLLMSFSRSSWLALMCGGTVMFVLCRHDWGMGTPAAMLKLAGAFAVMLVLLVAALIAVDAYSGGFIGRWISLNASGTDPSMQGHGQSFVDALNHLPDYFWVGFPKGTVSARALLFGGAVNNVENSVIGVFFEMGVPLGMIYLILIGFMLRGLWVHKSQWGVLTAFGVSSMFLPYIFEPDMISLFITVLTLLGRALQLAAQSPQDLPERISPQRVRRGRVHPSFQATVFEAR